MLKKTIKILNNIVELLIYCLVFVIPFSKTGIEIFATAAIIAWLTRQAISYNIEIGRYFPKTPLTKPVFALFAVYLVSAIFSTNINLSIKGLFFKVTEYILIFFICIDTFSNEEKRGRKLILLLTTILLSAVLLFADAGVQWVFGRDFIRGFRMEQLKACFSSPNGFAGYMIAILPILFCNFFLRFKKVQTHGS